MQKEEIAAVAATGGGVLTWIGKVIFGKRKAKMDMLTDQVEATLLMVDGWKKYALEMEATLSKRILYLEGVVVRLEKRIQEQDLIIYNFTHAKK